MAKRLKAGDVLELDLPRAGHGYIMYLGKHPRLGDAIRVSMVRSRELPPVRDALFSDSYIRFYPARAAHRQGLVRVVGHLPNPSAVPAVTRSPGAMTGRSIDTWLIVNAAGERQVLRSLSEAELRLPIAGIVDHEFLVKQIEYGWRPEMESTEFVDLTRGRAEVGAEAGAAELAAQVIHYLYFPDRDDARRAAEELRSQGLEVEERLGADGVNWLVQSRHVTVDESSDDARRALIEDVARRYHGEYDGWERELPVGGGVGPA